MNEYNINLNNPMQLQYDPQKPYTGYSNINSKIMFLYETKEGCEYIIKEGEFLMKLIIYEKYDNCSLIGLMKANDDKDTKSYKMNEQKFILIDEISNKHKRKRKINNLLKDDE